jgi:hypothetical protein
MQFDDEALNAVIARDRQWLASHEGELWVAAQSAYAESGRGAVVIVFDPVGGCDDAVLAYAPQASWPLAAFAEQIARYDPATQMVIVCLGQFDGTEVVAGPRSYRVQHLTLAA